jgi:7,8-dihydroneopterin aldolase/epimerase/oxygenase
VTVHRDVTIGLERLEAPCRIGVTEEERREAQVLLVDLRLAPLRPSSYAADDLGETVDYGAVAALVRATAAERPYNLLERLATEIADRVWAGHELAALTVTVRKPQPPLGAAADAALVEVAYRVS